MARNATLPLTGDALARSAHYAHIVSGMMGDDVATVTFQYTSDKGTDTREAKPVEIVGTPGTTTHGFKGETDKGPRTFNFHKMG